MLYVALTACDSMRTNVVLVLELLYNRCVYLVLVNFDLWQFTPTLSLVQQDYHIGTILAHLKLAHAKAHSVLEIAIS